MAKEHNKAPRWVAHGNPLRCLLTSLKKRAVGASRRVRLRTAPAALDEKLGLRSVRPVTVGAQLSGFTTSRPHYPFRPPPTR